MRIRNESLFKQHAFVDGEWIAADDGASDPVTNPVDSAHLGTVPRLGAVET